MNEMCEYFDVAKAACPKKSIVSVKFLYFVFFFPRIRANCFCLQKKKKQLLSPVVGLGVFFFFIL